jgi:CheY-like chemotaxis protein
MIRRALILEQQPAALEAAEQQFSAAGWEVDAAATCANAIALIEQRRYDIILTDFGWNDGSSPAARDLARSLELSQPEAAMVIVGSPVPGENARRVGIQLVLTQPIPLEGLVQLAERLSLGLGGTVN